MREERLMERKIGTVSRGVRCPIIREGDNLPEIVVNSVLEAAASEGFALRDRDVIAVTESVVARSQGNYATIEDIAADVKAKLGGGTIGVIFPILSRNRFAICLKGIAMGAKKIVLMLSYPSDEVGNALITWDQVDEAGINPYSDVLSLEKYRELFGENKHEFTGVDYVQYYADLIKEAGAEVEVVFANQAKTILQYTDCVLNCDIHTRARTKRILLAAGAKVVCSLDDILNAPVNGSGCNERYGLLGSNKSTEDKIKLFPRECQGMVEEIQASILEKTYYWLDSLLDLVVVVLPAATGFSSSTAVSDMNIRLRSSSHNLFFKEMRRYDLKLSMIPNSAFFVYNFTKTS